MPLTYTLCLVSSQNDIVVIYRDLIEKVRLKEVPFELDKQSFERFNRIKNYFDITDNQLNVVLKSYEHNKFDKSSKKPALSVLYLALTDLIREKMVLLSVEKTSQD
jgi:hypothetical protein